MKKKLLYLMIFIASLFIINTNVKAEDLYCRYSATYNPAGYLKIDYRIDGFGNYYFIDADSKTVNGEAYVLRSFAISSVLGAPNGGEKIQNWNDEVDYVKKNRKCPPYIILTTTNSGHYLYAADENTLSTIIESKQNDSTTSNHVTNSIIGTAANLALTAIGKPVLGLTALAYSWFNEDNVIAVELATLLDERYLGKEYTISFNSNLPSGTDLIGSFPTTKKVLYGDVVEIPEASFKVYGYQFNGWLVKSKNGWVCSDGTTVKDLNSCSKPYKVSSNQKIIDWPFDIDELRIELYADWKITSGVGPATINGFNESEATRKQSCMNNGYIWNEPKNGESFKAYCSVDKLTFVGCGNVTDIPSQVPSLVSFAINLLKIVTPIVLIIVSIVTLIKTVAAADEGEIKKAQKSLVKRLIAAAMVFFLVTITQFVISIAADEKDIKSINNCLDCFINNHCETSEYYKINVGGEEFCYNRSDSSMIDC